MATDIDLDGCCKICKETRDCHYYTYDMDSNTCYLKSIKQQNIKKDPSIGHLTSGKILNK